MSLISRIFRPSAVKHAEGDYRPGPYLINGGWLSADAGQHANWWQMGHSLSPYNANSAMVEACQGAYSQTVAMCPGEHWRLNPDGGRERVVNSALTRILRKPNDYQTISDFLMNLTRGLYNSGNAYALALRNDRNEISELHLMNPRNCGPRIAVTGDIFYDLGGNEIIERRIGASLIVPARDVLHVKLETPVHPLKGVSPLLAAALNVAASGAMMQHQIRFFLNQARPSYVLSSDQILNLEQVTQLRAAWDAQTRGLNAGGTPILSSGLKPLPLATTAKDSQIAEILKKSDEDIALAYRVPLPILGIGGTPFASTEALMQSWRATGLGFALNHIEEAFGILFGLRGQPDEYLELNTRSLMRASFKERMEGLSIGTLGGIFSPDEARLEEELARVPGGHGAEPRVQQQVVPLSYGSAMQPPPVPSPAMPAPPEPPADETMMDEVADAERYVPAAIAQRIYDNASRVH